MAADEVRDCNEVEFRGKVKDGAGECEVSEDKKKCAEECSGGKDESTDGSYEFVDDGKSDETFVEVNQVVESGGSWKENGFSKEGMEILSELDGELRDEKTKNGGVGYLDGSGKVEGTPGEDGGVNKLQEESGLNQAVGDQVDGGALDADKKDSIAVVQLPPDSAEGNEESSNVGEKNVERTDDINIEEENPEGKVVAEVKETVVLHNEMCNGKSDSNKLEQGSVVGENGKDVRAVQVPENARAEEEHSVTDSATVTEIVKSTEVPTPLVDNKMSFNSNGNSQASENVSDLKMEQEVKAEEVSERGGEVEVEERSVTISISTNSCAESQLQEKDVSVGNAENISLPLDDGENASNGRDNFVCKASPENNTVITSSDTSTHAHDGSSDGKNLDHDSESGGPENFKTIPDCDADKVTQGDKAENFSSEDEATVPCTVEEAESRYLATKALILKWDDCCDEVNIDSTEGKGPETSSPTRIEVQKIQDDQIRVEHNKDSPSKLSEYTSKDVDSTEMANDKETLPSTSPDLPSSAVPEQIVGSDLKRLPCYMIRVPKFFDDKLMARKENLELQVNEKTQSRDSIKSMLQNKKGTRDEYSRKLDAARKEEKAVRDLFIAKRNEIDAIQGTINKMKNATTINEIGGKINNLEHRIQHETISLSEEKQIIREIKTLKQTREKISSSLGPETKVLEAFDQKEQIESKFEHLTQEFNSLREKLLQVEMQTKGIKKKYDDECQSMRNLFVQHDAANNLRQETYSRLWSVKREYIDKNAHFYQYKDDRRAADNYASSGDKDALRHHCAAQVEKIMELWNNNDDFRNQYVKFNMARTVRRFRTLDARSLGPDEAPAVLPNLRVDKQKSSSVPQSTIEVSVASEEYHEKTSDHVTLEKTFHQSPNKVATKSRSGQSQISLKVPLEAITAVADVTESPSKVAEHEKKGEEEEFTKEANEIARQEELRKEKAAAELKEKAAAELKENIRIEQMAKAREAEERKRRKAEKAKAKAEFKARREAELKEKKKAKKDSRKEKKMAGLRGAENSGAEANSLPDSSTSQPETSQEPEIRVTTATKRPSKTPVLTKQNKSVKPLPPSLRNRGKRKMKPWMWMLLTAVVVLLLFLAGNYISFGFNFPYFRY